MTSSVAQLAHGHKPARRGPPPKSRAVVGAITPIWRYRPDRFFEFLRQDWCADDRRELKRDLMRYLLDRRRNGSKVRLLRARLREKWVTDEAQVSELIRCALALGLIRENQLDPRELPGELPVVLVDKPGIASITIRGTVRRRRGRLPSVSEMTLTIASYLDGKTVELTVSVAGSAKDPYLNTAKRPIERELPVLWKYLEANTLFASHMSERTRMVYLARLVETVAGYVMLGREAHHLEEADGSLWGGYATLDCRVTVLLPLTGEEHREYHQQTGTWHWQLPQQTTRQSRTLVNTKNCLMKVKRPLRAFRSAQAA